MITVTIPMTIPVTTMPLTLPLVLGTGAALVCLALHAACRAAAIRAQLRPVRVRRR